MSHSSHPKKKLVAQLNAPLLNEILLYSIFAHPLLEADSLLVSSWILRLLQKVAESPLVVFGDLKKEEEFFEVHHKRERRG